VLLLLISIIKMIKKENGYGIRTYMPIATVCLLKKIQIARPRILTSDELVTKADGEDRLCDNQLFV
jgi:hypothetical protein